MQKTIFRGALTLVVGFMLGGLAFYSLHDLRTHGESPFLGSGTSAGGGGGISTFSDIAIKVSPSVVNISTTKVLRHEPGLSEESPFLDLFGEFLNPYYGQNPTGRFTEQSTGSGVIVSSDGLIITNNHVVSGAEDIKVTLFNKKTYPAKVVGADPKTDLAILKIFHDGLPTIPWGDSDSLKVGQFVLAIGNPFRLSHTVTMGIISAVGRANVGIADYEDFIQTDAAINPGNSGGPLVDTAGKLIGINTAIFSQSGGYQGIGFAVPSNMAHAIMQQLLTDGKVVRGWLGVTMQELTPELAQAFGAKTPEGALIGDISKESPAAKAGLKPGDIIMDFNGQNIPEPYVLRNIIAQRTPGEKIPMTILRGAKPYRLNVTIGELPAEPVAEKPAPRDTDAEHEATIFTGMGVMSLTRDAIRQLGLAPGTKGVVVVEIAPGSPADISGLIRGDVIAQVDQKDVQNAEEFDSIASEPHERDSALLYVIRGGTKFYLTLKR